MTRDPALQKAIDAIGGYTKTAEALGLQSPSTVHGWMKCPLHRARQIAELAGMHPSELAPDHYDPPAPPVRAREEE